MTKQELKLKQIIREEDSRVRKSLMEGVDNSKIKLERAAEKVKRAIIKNFSVVCREVLPNYDPPVTKREAFEKYISFLSSDLIDFIESWDVD